MIKPFTYVITLLTLSLLPAGGADAFWNKQEEPKQKEAGEQSGSVPSSESEAREYIDVGTSETRLSEEEQEKIKAYVEEVQQQIQNSKDGTAAVQHASQTKAVQSAQVVQNSGLQAYEPVKALEPLRSAEAVNAAGGIQNNSPLEQARKIQDMNSQVKKVSKLGQKPAV